MHICLGSNVVASATDLLKGILMSVIEVLTTAIILRVFLNLLNEKLVLAFPEPVSSVLSTFEVHVLGETVELIFGLSEDVCNKYQKLTAVVYKLKNSSSTLGVELLDESGNTVYRFEVDLPGYNVVGVDDVTANNCIVTVTVKVAKALGIAELISKNA